MVHYFFGEKNEGVIYCILVGEYFADLEERKKKSVSFQKFIDLQIQMKIAFCIFWTNQIWAFWFRRISSICEDFRKTPSFWKRPRNLITKGEIEEEGEEKEE
jgi:hypothetical protein